MSVVNPLAAGSSIAATVFAGASVVTSTVTAGANASAYEAVQPGIPAAGTSRGAARFFAASGAGPCYANGPGAAGGASGSSSGPKINAPSIEDILGDPTIAQAWLVELSRIHLASESDYHIALGVANLVRLWCPDQATAANKHVTLAIKLLAGHGPRMKAAKWFKAQDGDARKRVEREAVQIAATLIAELPGLQDDIAEDPEEAREVGLHWLHRRDDIESISKLFRSIGEGQELLGALDQLDERAAEFHSMWSLVEAYEDDPRLSAVAWQDVEAWWGLLSMRP